MNDVQHITKHESTIIVRLTPSQIVMLLNLVAQRTNQLTVQALVSDYCAGLRRQWHNIASVLQETLNVAQKGWKDR